MSKNTPTHKKNILKMQRTYLRIRCNKKPKGNFGKILFDIDLNKDAQEMENKRMVQREKLYKIQGNRLR